MAESNTEYYVSSGRLDNCKKLFTMIGTNLDFSSISEDKLIELRKSAKNYIEKILKIEDLTPNKVLITSERLITSSNTKFNINTKEELAYFFINAVDPELKFLEAYEQTQDKESLKRLCFINFGIYIPALFKIEKIYNDYYRLYEDLCYRDSLRRH